MSLSKEGQEKPSIHRGVILIFTPSPKGVIKGQPPNITMFGIKSKVLMSASLVDDSVVSHSPPVLTPAPKGVIKGKPLNIAIFGISLKVQ